MCLSFCACVIKIIYLCIFWRFSGFWEVWEVFACKTCYINLHLPFKEIYHLNYYYHVMPVLTLKWSLNMSLWTVGTSQSTNAQWVFKISKVRFLKLIQDLSFWLLWCSVYSCCDQVAKTSILYRLFILFIAVTWSLTGNKHPSYASEKTQPLYYSPKGMAIL